MSDAAIYFHPDGYVTARDDLKGRHVAGESFLIGFLRHSGQKDLMCLAEDPSHAAGFATLAERHAPGSAVRTVGHDALADLAGPGCLFVPGANIEPFAWERRRVGQQLYSLCGVTHTTAEHPPMYGALLTAPIQPWDAVICTSEAARSTLEAILLPYADYLRHRLGASRIPMPRLPVIPLGIDTASYRVDPSAREQARAGLGLGSDDVAVLYVGRLSSHAKAHPVPMYQALQKAASRTKKRLVLIQAGWFAHEAVAEAYREGARRHCPDVAVIFVDGRPAEARPRIRAAADIFTSLADNVQETFGLTPVEAMAAGLPVVVSDWNGYRETVRDGVDGVRIPTWLPPAGTGQDLADAYGRGRDNYDYFIGRAALFTAVEIEAAAEAYARLADDADLRRRMGTAAQGQAARFDWSQIIPRYRDLWAQLAELRRQGAEIAPWRESVQSSPLWPDPMVKFRAYPTRALSGEVRLVRSEAATAALVAELAAEPLNSLAADVMSPKADLDLALDLSAPPHGASVDSLLARLPPERRPLMARSLVYLMKFGLLRVAP